MNIDKAIKINTEVAEMRGKRSTAEKREALWLSIEALKAIQRLHRDGHISELWQLPGETKD